MTRFRPTAKNWITGLLLGVLAGIMHAQPSISRWEQVRSESGTFPRGRIHCLMLDRMGFLWIGLGNGLMQYDGYRYTHYQHDPDDPRSLGSDWVTCLAEDRNGDIWVGTHNAGLYRYHRATDDFSPFVHDPDDPDSPADGQINNVCFDREGRMWVATGAGLDLAQPDPASGKVRFRHFQHDPGDPQSPPPGSVMDVAQDGDGRIWVGTFDKGLARMEPAPGGETSEASFTSFRFDPEDSLGLGGDKTYDLVLGPDGELAVTHTRGISFLLPDEQGADRPRFINHSDENLDPGAPFTVVHQAYVDPYGRMWAVSAFGIHRFREGRYLESFHPREMGLRSRGLNVFYDMVIDPSGLVWLGGQEGLFRTPQARSQFRVLRMPPEAGPTTVTGLLRDHRGQLWIGLEDNGLLLLDAQNRPYARFRHSQNDPHSLLNDLVTCLLEDSRGRVWVGTYGGGLHLTRPERGPDGKVTGLKFTRLFGKKGGKAPLPDPYIYDLIEARDHTIWVGSFYGAGYYDESTERFEGEPVFVANAVFEDHRGRIWAGTDRGLFYWQSDPDSLVQYPFPDHAAANLDDHLLLCLAEDHRQRLWIGSTVGLVRLPTDDDPGEWLRRQDGLSGNVIHDLVPDGHTGFWMNTDAGITHFDVEKGTFRNFDQRDGLLNERFTNRSIYRDTQGVLYFCGDQGVDYFHPDSLGGSTFDPPVYITGFRLFNHPLNTHDESPGGLRLPRQIYLLDSLHLRHSDKVFTIEFAALDFRQSASMRYRFILEGFDRDWRETDPGQHSVTYTNLDPGEYRFRVMAVNADGQPSEREARLRLFISPPWWRTIWAYLLYAALGLGLTTLAFRLRISAVRREMATQARITQARVDERDQVRASSSRDFHDEAGNKLTRISLYLALLKQQAAGETDTAPLLDKIEDNLQALSGGMRDFIWILDPRHDNLPDLVLRLAHFGDELFEASEVRFRFENQLPENLDTTPDVRTKRHLLLIFKEAMHNALRHAAATEVVLTARLRGNTLEIILEDDGKGFDEAALERVNGMQNMRDRATEIGGELKLETAPGKGTKWVFRMALGGDGQ